MGVPHRPLDDKAQNRKIVWVVSAAAVSLHNGNPERKEEEGATRGLPLMMSTKKLGFLDPFPTLSGLELICVIEFTQPP